MALTLEQTLDKVASDNNLSSVAVGRMPVGPTRVLHTAIIHWDGFSRDGISCASGQSEISIADALNTAVKKAASDRTPADPAMVEVPAFEAIAA